MVYETWKRSFSSQALAPKLALQELGDGGSILLLPVPGFNLQNALDVVTNSELPGLTLTAAVTPEPVAPDSAPLEAAPRAATPSDAVPPSNDQPSPEHTAANTPDRPPPTPVTTSSREVSVQVSPRLAKPVPLERVPTDAGELSPPASEETLREETEGVDKEQETAPSAAKDTSLHQKDDPMPIDTPPDRVMADIPLSDALRLVAKLRFRHDPITQDARIEPILISNRQLVESEPVEEPAPRQEAFVQSVVDELYRLMYVRGAINWHRPLQWPALGAEVWSRFNRSTRSPAGVDNLWIAYSHHRRLYACVAASKHDPWSATRVQQLQMRL